MTVRESAQIPSLRALRDYDGAFDRAFGLVAFMTNRHLVDHMLRSARLLTDGDYEALIIFGVLAHQNVAHLMPPGSLPTAVLTENGRIADDAHRLRPMRLRDVAAITGIPRETTRRKLEKLAAERLVVRVSAGWQLCDARLESELRGFTRDTVLRLLSVADDVRQVLVQADAAAPTSTGRAMA